MVSIAQGQQDSNNEVFDIRAEIAAAWRKREQRPVSEVVSENYRLSRKREAEPGPYNLTDYPYWRLPLDLWIHRKCRRITILKSVQVGGTITFQGAMLATSLLDPSPIMYVLPTEDEAIDSRDRIYENALASSPAFKSMVPPKNFWNKRSIDLGNMKIYLAWSKSLQRVRAKPCKRVFRSESDVFAAATEAGDPRTASDGRMVNFYGHCSCDESSPVGADSYIANEYDRSNRMGWWCKCPECGMNQLLRFFPFKTGKLAGKGGVVGYHDDDGNLMSAGEARRSAYYRCVAGCKISNQFKSLFVRSGIWVAAETVKQNKDNLQEMIDRDRAAGKLYVGDPDLEHTGCHVWSMMSAKKTFGDIAYQYIEHVQKGKVRDFWQNWLGLRYRSRKKIPTFEVLAKKYDAGYRRGHVPTDCWFLTGGVDAQKSFCPWLIIGWSWGRTPWLIDWGECHQREVVDEHADDEHAGGVRISSDLAQLPSKILNNLWPVMERVEIQNQLGWSPGQNLLGRDSLECRLCGIDTNYRMMDLHNFMQAVDSKRMRHVFGDHNVSRRDKWRSTVIERSARDEAKVYEGGMNAWRFNKSLYQEGVDQRLHAPPGDEGSFRFPLNAESDGEKVMKQLANVKENYQQKKFGEPRREWDMIVSHVGQDFRDCFIIAELCADMVVADIGWSKLDFMRYRTDLLDAQRNAAGRNDDDERESILEGY